MKRFLSMALCIVMALGILSGCGQKTNDTPKNDDNSTALSGSVSTNGSTSMDKVIGALKEQFTADNPGVTVPEDYVAAIQNRIALQYNYAQLLVAYDYYAIALPDADHAPNAPQVTPPTPPEGSAETGEEQPDTLPEAEEPLTPSGGTEPES